MKFNDDSARIQKIQMLSISQSDLVINCNEKFKKRDSKFDQDGY